MAATRAAFESRGRYHRLTERDSRWFLPAVRVVARAAFACHSVAVSLAGGIHAGLAVLLIACPCALGIATPLAIWTALGVAARRQVLFRSGEALERLAAVRAFRFDKTGTLTTGLPTVERFEIAPQGNAPKVLACARRLASASSHGQSIAIRHYAESRRAPDSGDALLE
jgi:P-type E1-E2 ATPase